MATRLWQRRNLHLISFPFRQYYFLIQLFYTSSAHPRSINIIIIIIIIIVSVCLRLSISGPVYSETRC